jgi:hypothetical protein
MANQTRLTSNVPPGLADKQERHRYPLSYPGRHSVLTDATVMFLRGRERAESFQLCRRPRSATIVAFTRWTDAGKARYRPRGDGQDHKDATW